MKIISGGKELKMDETKVLRIITKPYRYNIHHFANNDIRCSANGVGLPSCYLCNYLDDYGRPIYERIPRFYVGAIDRSTESYCIIDITESIFRQIRDLYFEKGWATNS